MKAKVNVQMLSKTTFDSGALGLMAMVLHQFDSPGQYRAAVMEQGAWVTDIDFEVDEKSQAMQLDIDLAQAVRAARGRPRSCCPTTKEQTALTVSPKGYVLFHASSEGGYSVTVSAKGSRSTFDSTKLGAGDLFAVSLLEPADYSMANTLGSATGHIVVKLTSDSAKRIRALETRHIDVGERAFDPGRVELISSQGLVFRVKESARILIERKRPAPTERPKPILRRVKMPMVRRD